MTDAQIKSAAIVKLRKLGADLPDTATAKQITHAIETYTPAKRYFGNQHLYFVRAFVCPPEPPAEKINLMARPEYRPARHLRQDEIDSLPSQVCVTSTVRGFVGYGDRR